METDNYWKVFSFQNQIPKNQSMFIGSELMDIIAGNDNSFVHMLKMVKGRAGYSHEILGLRQNMC